MDIAILTHFIFDNSIVSTCDFSSEKFQNGTNIYEVLKIEKGVPVFLNEHLKRFYLSAKLENIPLEISEYSLRLRIKTLLEINKMIYGNIKFLYHYEKKNHHFYAWVTPFNYPTDIQYKNGVKVEVIKANRPNPNAKKELYNLRQMADNIIKSKKCYEVLYMDDKNNITEGSRSNVFFVINDMVYTAPIQSVLPGVTRKIVFEIAKNNNIKLTEEFINLHNLKNIDSCFLTGTSAGILPVNSIGKLSFNTENQLMKVIQNLYEKKITDEIKHFKWDIN